MKDRINNIFGFILFMIFVLVGLLMLNSCGSRKKVNEKEAFKVERIEETSTKNISQNDIKTVDEFTEVKKRESETNTDVFKGKVADITKPATVTTETNNGKRTTTYSNFTEIDQTNVKENQTLKDSISNLWSNIDKSKNTFEENKRLKEQIESLKKSKTNESKKGFPFWILILVAGVGYFVTSLFKGYNPFRWF